MDLGGDTGTLIDQIRELQLSADRFLQHAEYANDVLWTMSLDGTITDTSAGVERVRGLTPAEAMAQPIDEILTPASQIIVGDDDARLHAALQSGEPLPKARTELEHYHRDATTVWFDVLVIPYINPDGEVVEILGVSRDISERKRHELDLTRAHDQAEKANHELADQVALLQDFASVAADDLRGPLATIRMLLDTLSTVATDDLDDGAMTLLTRVGAQTDRAIQTVDGLLNLARSSRPQLARVVLDLGEIVNEVFASLRTARPEDDARVEVGPLHAAIGDRVLLRVLLDNLLSDALRYRHPQRRLAVTVTASSEAGWVTVCVKDNGRGWILRTSTRCSPPSAAGTTTPIVRGLAWGWRRANASWRATAGRSARTRSRPGAASC